MNDIYYIVSGDEMKKLMDKNSPGLKCIPFREDFSRGKVNKFYFDDKLISERSKFFNVTKEEYYSKLEPIINIDLDKEYVLMFGEDDCCKANLNFMINYLKYKNYSKQVKVRIVNEYTLELIREYYVTI